MTKPSVTLTLTRPKTTVTLAKQGPRATPKPSTVNQTVSATPATNQKPPAVNAAKTTKSKPMATLAIQAALAKPAVTSTQKTVKDKSTPAVVQTVHSTPSKTVMVSSTTTTKDKAPAKSPATDEAKTNKDKPVSKDKSTATVNQAQTKTDTKTAKDKVQSTVLTTTAKPATGTSATAVKDKASAADQTAVAKDKPAPAQPIQVVISGFDPSQTKEKEIKLKPGAPLVMTHKISLVPGSCTGSCLLEMAALKGRVARLEREMSTLKNKCPCSLNCPNECSGNGRCDKGKCVCQQGFLGPDCNKCAPGVDCKKKSAKEKVTVDSTTLQVNQESNAIRDTTQKKDLKKPTEVDNKQKASTQVKVSLVKTQGNQGAAVSKTTVKDSASGKTTLRPTVGQVLLKHEGRKHEEARKGKTTVLTGKTFSKTEVKLVKEGTADKVNARTSQLKDQPQMNVTQSVGKKSNGTAKVLTILTKVTGASNNKTRPGKEASEQSTLAEKTVAGKGKGTQRSQYLVNVSHAEATSDAVKRAPATGLGSIKVSNITSYTFTLTWAAPQGMFNSFTVNRREYRTEGEEEDEDEEEEVEEGPGDDKAGTAKNATDVQVHGGDSSNATTTKVPATRGKAESKRFSVIVPGTERSVEFTSLRPLTRYSLHIFGVGATRRSKIHRVTVMTGPEPATELVFSNVTESSLAVSWTKPKTTLTGFRITYTHSVTGQSSSVSVDPQQSHVVLTQLSAGAPYLVSVTVSQGKIQSDALTSTITTVPAPPTHLQVVNITDTRAVLQWTPSLGKVDRFIISYESSKTPNVTVTVMVSGSSLEHHLRGLQRGTLYTVKALSQKDSLQSTSISTTFTTANAVKASEVSARSAVVSWRAPAVPFHSYRLTYQVVGEETKEVTLEPTITEYKLTGLLSMSKYFVLVQGERDGHYTSIITTEFITGKLRFPFPTECAQELLNGALQSGEVDIFPYGREGGPVRVYCDMETDGGGWTVFQRRMNGKTDFYRTWSEYTTGFGNISDEFWLGNELLHNLTTMGAVSLRVDMTSGLDSAYAHYANFTVDSEDHHYAIALSGYTGTAGDSMKYHNGRPFSTRDKDPDPLGIHCARAYMGGWWYKNCYKTNLNGLYGMNSNNQGVVWIDWKGKDSSISFTEMKIRPAGFSPATHG